MFCRMMGIDPLSFNGEILTGIYEDADDISEWAYNYVKAAYFLGIMTGSKNLEGKQVFNCKANITRQEFFQAMSNLLKQPQVRIFQALRMPIRSATGRFPQQRLSLRQASLRVRMDILILRTISSAVRLQKLFR